MQFSDQAPSLSCLSLPPLSSSLDERYKVMREVADTHSVLSLGVACFRWDERGGESEGGGEERERGGEGWKEEGRSCSAEVFNVWLSCQRDYILNPQSACFLLEHGFDFNKQLSKGLLYTPGQAPVSQICVVHCK